MRLRWAVLTPPLCLLSLPSALPIAGLPGLAGLPGRRGNLSPGPGGWQRPGQQGDPPIRRRDCPGAAGREARGELRPRRRMAGCGGTPGLGGRWGLTLRVNASPPAFYFISFTSLHSSCLLCRVLPRGGCPRSRKGRGLGDPIQILPSPASARKCHHQSHRS